MIAIRRFLTAAIMVVLAMGGVSAMAEDAPVRLTTVAGNDYRLSLNLRPENGWSVQQFEDLIEVRFPGLAVEIALPTAIRPPLAEVTSEIRGPDTFVRLVASCACTLAISARGETLTFELAETRTAKTRPSPTHAPMPTPKGEPGVLTGSADGDPREVEMSEVRERLMSQLLKAAEAGLIELDAPQEAEDGSDITDAAVAEEAERAVGETSADDAANSTGTDVEMSKAETPKSSEPSDKGDRTNGADMVGADDAAAVASEAEETEVMDGDAAGQEMAEAVPAICHPPEAFELPVFNSGTEWVKSIAKLRSALTGEFDRTDASVALQMARAYLATGLPEEARAVVAEFADGSAEAVLVSELIDVFDGRKLNDGASVLRPDCLGAQALWRALAHANGADASAAVDAAAASGRALERTPTTVRSGIAARLGLAATKASEFETARDFQAMVNRTPSKPSDQAGHALLLSAALAAWEEKHDEQFALLNQARAAEPAIAAEAAFQMAEQVIAGGVEGWKGIKRLISDLGILARLHRGSPDGLRAAELEIRLTDKLKGRRAALDLMTLGLEVGDLEEADFSRILSSLAENDDDESAATIASIYLQDPEALGPALTDDRFRAILAKSLIELGLPAKAAGLFDGRNMPSQVSAALAGGYLDIGDHRAALGVIADLPEGKIRAALLKRASLGTGNGTTTDGQKWYEPGVTDPGRLRRMARLAVAAGDLDRALSLTLETLRHDKNLKTAETAALIALSLGKAEMPAPVKDALAAADRGLHDRMSALFANRTEEIDADDPASATAFLTGLDAEIAVIEDMLEDG